MIQVLVVWLLTLFIATAASSIYVRTTGKPDALYAMYVVYLALSQVLASKLAVFDFGVIAFVAPAAAIIFPFTFQITDMVNEYFGRKETHRMIFIAFITQVLMVAFIYMANELVPASFWGLQDAWLQIFNLSIRITAASWISFLITENLDAVVFAKIREWTGAKYLWIRNVGSDVPMLFLDSAIFIPLAFYGVVPTSVLFDMIVFQAFVKWFSGVLDTPFIYLDRYLVKSDLSWLEKLLGKPLPIKIPIEE